MVWRNKLFELGLSAPCFQLIRFRSSSLGLMFPSLPELIHTWSLAKGVQWHDSRPWLCKSKWFKLIAEAFVSKYGHQQSACRNSKICYCGTFMPIYSIHVNIWGLLHVLCYCFLLILFWCAVSYFYKFLSVQIYFSTLKLHSSSFKFYIFGWHAMFYVFAAKVNSPPLHVRLFPLCNLCYSLQP